MPKFCANLGFMFPEFSFLDRIGAAAAAGFRAVEFPYPYEFEANAIAERIAAHDLTQVMINTPKGSRPDDHGLACDPDRRGEFQDSIGRTVAYALALGTSRVHVMAGTWPKAKSRAAVMDVYVDNLRFAARALAEHGVKAMIEAINTKVDVPGYVLSRPSDALALIRDAAEPNLYLEFDFYHAQVMEGNITALFKEALPHVGHVQVADTPGRHEPGTGEINYAFVFRFLDEVGWNDWIGCEYRPLGSTLEGLGWIKPYLG